MKYYLSPNWVKELNTQHTTKLYLENGEPAMASIGVSLKNDKPIIFNAFGTAETLHLKRLSVDDDGSAVARIETEGFSQIIHFDLLEEPELITEWSA